MRKAAMPLLGVVFVVACSTAPQASPTPLPTVSIPSPSPAVTPPSSTALETPSASATPTTEASSAKPTSWTHVTGTETVEILEGPTVIGNVVHVRSNTVDTMTDPRVTGTGTVIETITGDLSTGVGLNQSTYSLKNAGGSWDGQCAGAEWASGNGADITCWLRGGGGYSGMTYYLNVTEPTPGSLVLDGLIYRGPPPTL